MWCAKMEILVTNSRQGNNSTLSSLFINDEFVCYVLEDSVRDEKIAGSTAIPAGRYKLAFNRYGAMNGRYKRWFPEFHRGMIELTGIPNFSYVYIHMGNNFGDTAGCLLVGKQLKYFKREHEYEIRKSRAAYVALYQRLAKAMEEEEVYLTIERKKQINSPKAAETS